MPRFLEFAGDFDAKNKDYKSKKCPHQSGGSGDPKKKKGGCVSTSNLPIASAN
jgi:hypothetical protein